MELFKLFGTIAVNNQEANENIDETSGKAEGFASKLASGIGTVAQWSAAIVTGTAAAVGSMVAFANSQTEVLDNIDKMSQRLGMSTEAYQEWDYILGQSGVDIDSMMVGMKTMTNVMGDVIASGTTAGTAFEQLGLSYEDLAGKTQEEIFAMSVEALQGVEDQTVKAALAQDLFGKSGMNMIPLLNQTAESTEELRTQAHELGLVYDEETIQQGVELHDTMDTLKRSFGAVAMQLASGLMPVVNQFGNYLISYMPQIQAMMERLAPVIGQVFDGLLPPLMSLVEQIFPILVSLIESILPPITQIVSAILPIIVQLLQTLLPPALQIVEAVLPIVAELLLALLPILEPLIGLLQPILDLVLLLLEPLLGLIETILPPLIEGIVDFVDVITAVLTPILEGLVQYIGAVFNVAIDQIRIVVGTVVGFVQERWHSMKDTIMTVFSAIGNFIGTTMTAISSKITSVWNAVKNTVSTVVNAIKSTISSVFNAVKSTVTTIWNGIKTAMETPIENAKNKIKSIVDTIKGFFSNLNISFPNIPLPHFSVSPSGWKVADLLQGTIPSLGISWYAKGGIMDGITPFGLNGNQLMVGGEAGKEAIIPLEKDTRGIELIASKLEENMHSENSVVIQEKMNTIIKLLEMLTGMKIVLDSGAMVGQLAPAMDVALGDIYAAKGRGGRSRW